MSAATACSDVSGGQETTPGCMTSPTFSVSKACSVGIRDRLDEPRAHRSQRPLRPASAFTTGRSRETTHRLDRAAGVYRAGRTQSKEEGRDDRARGNRKGARRSGQGNPRRRRELGHDRRSASTTIGVESTEESRRAYRELLFTTEGAAEHISGVILYDETIRQSAADGTPFPQLLERQGVIPGHQGRQGREAARARARRDGHRGARRAARAASRSTASSARASPSGAP